MSDSTVEPPNSRLFILCSKSVTDEELREAFNKYGHIEDIWIVKDKMSGDNKGTYFI
jgi:RNA recognition motif-containing protein